MWAIDYINTEIIAMTIAAIASSREFFASNSDADIEWNLCS